MPVILLPCKLEKNMILKERVYTAEAAETIGISKATLLRWFAEGRSRRSHATFEADEFSRSVRLTG